MKKITTTLLLALRCGTSALAIPRLKAGDRIVTLGDSITQAGGYQALMQKVLARFYPDFGIEIVNAGISGHKAPDMAARLQRDVIDKKPTIVTVSCGVNDVWYGFYTQPRGVDIETYTHHLMTQMVQQLKATTSAAIYLLTPTVIHENLRGPENLKMEAYCYAIREITRRENVQLVDLNAVFSLVLRSTQIGGAPEFHPTTDCVHMEPAGNFLIAAAILQALAGSGVVSFLANRSAR